MTLVVDDISPFPNTKELRRLRKAALFVIVGTGATGRTTFREILSSTIFVLIRSRIFFNFDCASQLGPAEAKVSCGSANNKSVQMT